MTEHEELWSYISDAHKDAHGFRPRHIDFPNLSVGELEVIAEKVTVEVGETMRREEAMEKEATKDFETLVALHIRLGAPDRETALRWIADATGDWDTDGGYVCWVHGIPYSYAIEINAALDGG